MNSSLDPDNHGPSSCRLQFIVLTPRLLSTSRCAMQVSTSSSSFVRCGKVLLHTLVPSHRDTSGSLQFTSLQGGICALGKAHMSSIPTFRRLLSVGFERDTVLAGLTMAASRPVRLLSYQHVFQTHTVICSGTPSHLFQNIYSPVPEHLVTCSRTPSHLFQNT